VIAQATAAKLLEEVLYARVLECLDVRKLFMIELDLWVALCESQGEPEQRARELAKDMIDRALTRVVGDPDRYATLSPFGTDCDLCGELEDDDDDDILDTRHRGPHRARAARASG
jgi:hypothetical protein